MQYNITINKIRCNKLCANTTHVGVTENMIANQSPILLSQLDV